MKLFDKFDLLHEDHRSKGALLEQEVEKRTGRKLSKIEVRTLVYLYRLEKAGIKVNCADLARMLKVTLPYITAIYRNLEKQRLTRVPKQGQYDRRQRNLRTTPTGAKIAEMAEDIETEDVDD